jgi:hypothetical protein
LGEEFFLHLILAVLRAIKKVKPKENMEKEMRRERGDRVVNRGRIGDKAKKVFSSSTCVCTSSTNVAKITVGTKKMQSFYLYDQTL